jgi:hypothetical protein
VAGWCRGFGLIGWAQGQPDRCPKARFGDLAVANAAVAACAPRSTAGRPNARGRPVQSFCAWRRAADTQSILTTGAAIADPARPPPYRCWLPTWPPGPPRPKLAAMRQLTAELLITAKKAAALPVAKTLQELEPVCGHHPQPLHWTT